MPLLTQPFLFEQRASENTLVSSDMLLIKCSLQKKKHKRKKKIEKMQLIKLYISQKNGWRVQGIPRRWFLVR